MPTIRRMLLAAVMVAGAVSTAAAQPARFSAPKDYVLALGDSLIFLCANGDIHPRDAGYRVMGGLMWAASGYASFER